MGTAREFRGCCKGHRDRYPDRVGPDRLSAVARAGPEVIFHVVKANLHTIGLRGYEQFRKNYRKVGALHEFDQAIAGNNFGKQLAHVYYNVNFHQIETDKMISGYHPYHDGTVPNVERTFPATFPSAQG